MDHRVNVGTDHQCVPKSAVRPSEYAEKIADPVRPDLETGISSIEPPNPAFFFAFRKGETRPAAAGIQPHRCKAFDLPEKHIVPYNRPGSGFSS
jgi:hypothetical protein